jgi:hypothetical protein
MRTSPNQTRQPTPGERLASSRTSVARRGCAHRSFGNMRAMKVSFRVVLVLLAVLSGCSRAPEFRAQALAGQPIVRAIENYRSDTGSYPESLAALVPKY